MPADTRVRVRHVIAHAPVRSKAEDQVEDQGVGTRWSIHCPTSVLKQNKLKHCTRNISQELHARDSVYALDWGNGRLDGMNGLDQH